MAGRRKGSVRKLKRKQNCLPVESAGMADVRALAEQVKGLVGAATPAEQAPLAAALESDLQGILTVPNVAKGLQERLADPLADGLSLSDWCRKRVADGCFTEEAFAPLVAVAELVDYLATMPEPSLFFVPRWFRVTDAGKVVAPWPLLSLGKISPKMPRLTDFQRKEYGGLLHPNLLRSLAGCDAGAAIAYSMGLFLLEILLDIRAATKAELQDALLKCRLHNSRIPPQIPTFLPQVDDSPCRQAKELFLPTDGRHDP